jgi:hypothetical protein
MIRNAVATERVDYCLPINEIATHLDQLLLRGTTNRAESMTELNAELED